MIIYCPGKNNAKADILSRREQDLGPQENLRAHLRTRALLQPEQIDPAIRDLIDLYPLDKAMHEPILLINRILSANRIAVSLQAL